MSLDKSTKFQTLLFMDYISDFMAYIYLLELGIIITSQNVIGSLLSKNNIERSH